MRIKISNKTFYNRHSRELEKYQFSNSANLININSKDKLITSKSKNIYIDTGKIDEFLNKSIDEKYEYLIFTDVLEHISDINSFINHCKKMLLPNGKLIVSSVNTKYRYMFKLFEFFNLKDKNILNSYLNNKKISVMFQGLGFEFIKTYSRQIIPFKLFFLGSIFNKVLEIILSPFNLGFNTYSIYRVNLSTSNSLKKTIIIPAKNEEGNLEPLISRIPKMSDCEIIISCGESKDKTLEKAIELSKKEDFFKINVITQTKTGKANAVWEACKVSTGDVVAILDADISVEPEVLPKFFDSIEKNESDFVNGTRLVYEMEKGSMRFINKIGNRIFQSVVGSIISTPLTDSLCGTKVFRKEMIEKIFWWQEKFSLRDPFGDFDLIFTAAFTGLKLTEIPIHYKTRVYGETQIYRFRDGFKLIKYLTKAFSLFNTSR